MIPRFSNPHRLPDSTNITSRSELYPREGEDAEISFTEDPIAIAQLNELLAKNTALLRHESNIVTPRSRKHTPTESEDSHESRLEKPICKPLIMNVIQDGAYPPTWQCFVWSLLLCPHNLFHSSHRLLLLQCILFGFSLFLSLIIDLAHESLISRTTKFRLAFGNSVQNLRPLI